MNFCPCDWDDSAPLWLGWDCFGVNVVDLVENNQLWDDGKRTVSNGYPVNQHWIQQNSSLLCPRWTLYCQSRFQDMEPTKRWHHAEWHFCRGVGELYRGWNKPEPARMKTSKCPGRTLRVDGMKVMVLPTESFVISNFITISFRGPWIVSCLMGLELFLCTVYMWHAL